MLALPSPGRFARLLALCVALVALARGAHADVPLPPKPTRWVTDTAAVLSPAARDALDGKLEAYERQTGHQIVVWIGQSIGDAALDDFAVRTFKAWQIGRKGHDDGVLVLVLAKDRKIDVEVGYGLEDRVPDATAKRVIDDVMVPALRAGDADRALTTGVDALLSAIEGHAPPQAEPGAQPTTGPPAPSTLQMVLYGVLGFAFLIFFITHPSLAMYLLFSIFNGGGGFGNGRRGGGGGFSGGGGRSGGGGARGSW